MAIPEGYLDLLQQKTAFANLATIMPDGTPQVTPVWFDYTDGKIRVNSAKGRVKSRNMREDAPVALSILDPENPYRYIQIRGRVAHVTEEGASAHIDSLAKKYLGKTNTPTASRTGARYLRNRTDLHPSDGPRPQHAPRLQKIADSIAILLQRRQVGLPVSAMQCDGGGSVRRCCSK